MEVEITQTLKPLRLLFLIVPYNKPSFLKAIQLCSAYFGGKYFPIIPFYQKFSLKFSIQQGVYGKKIGEFADIDHLISAQTDHRFRGKLTT